MNKCNICGGSIVRKGNYYVCEYCHNKFEIDVSNDVHAVDRANAWAALRDGDFEKAAALFEDIIIKDGTSHESYFGRALAENGIIYVTDLSENKKVPTCNNITENVFMDSKDVKKAISLAPKEIAESYKAQAAQIDKIRVEWLEKASREPQYDVFISFKDSDREHDIERTKDSIDAQDLYNALTAEGYRVFFSRVSLRDKVSEQYEPYIYNAIKTAKVMIVFGEKPEYFNAVWIKNEWSRFKNRIEKGEKHKNSLVVVYKNMNPGDLPAVLKSRQCLNFTDVTFFTDLNKHIKRVISDLKSAGRLEKIDVKGGQIAKKATRISNETIKTREIGTGAVNTSINEKQQLKLVISYSRSEQWEDAKTLLDNILFDNPNFYEAIWQSIIVKHKIRSEEKLSAKLSQFSKEDYAAIEKTLTYADKEFAAEKLNVLYAAAAASAERFHNDALKVILPFNFSGRDDRIREAFKKAISKDQFRVFKTLLSTVAPTDVDTYIKYNLSFAEKTKSEENKAKCIENVLKVDEGNIDALGLRFRTQWENADTGVLIATFENILKYSEDTARIAEDVLDFAAEGITKVEHCTFANEALKYYPGDLKGLSETLIKVAEQMIKKGFYDEAEEFLKLVIEFLPEDAEVYKCLCLTKTRVKTFDDIVKTDIPLKGIPEYTKYMTLVDEDLRQRCISLAKRQEKAINDRKNKREAEALAAARLRRKKKIKRAFTAIIIIAIAVAAVILIRHDYSASPVWTWTDYGTARVTFTCDKHKDVKTVDAVITEERTASATCDSVGTKVYTATAEFNGETYTDIKSEDYYGHTFVDGTCTSCGEKNYKRVTKSGEVSSTGDYILLGSYPQSEVKDEALTESLNTIAGKLPKKGNSRLWTSYGYYISGKVKNYMWYIDVLHEGERYRGVYFTKYRPQGTSQFSSATRAMQDNNGYDKKQVYWFRYDPVKWNILSEENGKALLLCDMIIDSREFQNSVIDENGYYYTADDSGNKLLSSSGMSVYSNDYTYSSIRKWLQNEFASTAFDALQRELIVATKLSGTAEAESTEAAEAGDTIFLLSDEDVKNPEYGFKNTKNSDEARSKLPSEYAKVQGVYFMTKEKDNANWILRSSYPAIGRDIYSVDVYNKISFSASQGTTSGICPAMWIKL